MPYQMPSIEEDERLFGIVLGECIRERRVALHLTQVEAATKAGISRSEVQFIENHGREPKLGTIRRFCRALGIGCVELMAEVERRTQERWMRKQAWV